MTNNAKKSIGIWAALLGVSFLIGLVWMMLGGETHALGILEASVGRNTASTTAGVVGETGTVTVGLTWQTVNLTHSYNNPVVVAFSNTRNGGQSVDVRVRNVTASSFEIVVREPDDGNHNPETVSYIVMENGRFVLDGGLIVEAGTVDTDSVHVSGDPFAGPTVLFYIPFSPPPTILHTLNSNNNDDFMSSIVHNVTTHDFQIQQEAAGAGSTSTTETIGWIAFSTGNGSSSGQNYEIGVASDGTADGEDDATPHTISFSSFANAPDVVVAQVTGNDLDGAWARGAGIYSSTTQTVYALEDQVGDGERSHGDESFAWAAFAPKTVFQANCPAIIYVDKHNPNFFNSAKDGTSWDDAFPNLNDALDLATTCGGGEIWVANGSYLPDEGNGRINNDPTQSFVLTDNIEIYGGFQRGETSLDERDWVANKTVLAGDIDGNDQGTNPFNRLIDHYSKINGVNSSHVIRATNATNLVLDGLYISGGDANAGSANGNGAAMHLTNVDLMSRSITVQGNRARRNNLGRGAIYHVGGTYTIQDSWFTGNRSYHGGSLFLDNMTVEVNNTTFTDNYAEAGGGAVYLSSGVAGTWENVQFIGNETFISGGAAFIDRAAGQRFETVIVSGNRAGYKGGGIFNDRTPVTLINVTIHGNQQEYAQEGVGLYLVQNAFRNSVETLSNVILWGNQSVDGTGAVAEQIWVEGNDATPPVVSHSLIQNSGGSAAWNVPNVTDSGNNIDADPHFLSVIDPTTTPTTDGDSRLWFGSPAVNAGDDNVVTVATDLDDNPRQDGAVDMGAYEGIAANCLVEADGDNVTDFSSVDASAVQTAVNAASANDILKIAGYCAGVNNEGGTDQTVLIDKNLTLAGGYNASNWLEDPDYATFPTTLDAEQNGRVIYAPSTSVTLTLTGLHITGGNIAGDGGGVRSRGTLHITDSVIANNTATVLSNSAAGGGVAIEGTLVMKNTAVRDNSSVTGGGVGTIGNSPTAVTVRQSTFSGNMAVRYGGGLYSNATTTTVENSTLSDNDAGWGGGGYADGGNANATIRYTTIVNNRSSQGSGGLDLLGTANMEGVIVADNTRNGTAHNFTYSGATLNSLGYNIDDLANPNFTAAGDQVNTDPLLGVLTDNGDSLVADGSTTQTHTPLAGSPALDLVPDGHLSCGTAVTVDQRGQARPFTTNCDAGAVESALGQDAVCFVEATGDNITDFANTNASAIQFAVNAAAADDFLKIAGTCAGVNNLGGTAQTVFVDKNITLAGGYDPANWLAAPDYASFPTTLDAEENGRVIHAPATGVTVSLTGLNITGGDITGDGGGVYSGGTLHITDSAIFDNTASGTGGGVLIKMTLEMTNTVVLNNNATTGGGVGTSGSPVELTVRQSTFAGNTAAQFGGGLHSNATTTTVENSTLSGNSALWGGGGYADGNNADATTFRYTTIANNLGGGLDLYGSITTLEAVIIADNTVNGNPKNFSYQSGAVLNSAGYNIDDLANPNLTAVGDQVNTDPLLDVLADNGGLPTASGNATHTHAPLAGSPALNTIPQGQLGCGTTITNDQRAEPRPEGSKCDAGAFEEEAPDTQAGPNFVVNTAADGDDSYCGILPENDCTLREAINAANADGVASTITFAEDYTITLVGSELPNVTSEITISGNGANQTIIQAAATANTATYGVFRGEGANSDLTLDGLTVQNGVSDQGAIFTSDGQLTINASIIRDNYNLNGLGLGAGVGSSNSDVLVTNSTFVGNQGPNLGAGGAIGSTGFSSNSVTTINSTFSDNYAQFGGGAIFTSGPTLTIINSTIADNMSDSGGGLYLGGSFNYANTIIANNSGGNCQRNGSSIGLNLNNLVEGGGCSAAINADPLLAPLADNGGPTPTFALLSGSPAIDAGDSATCADPNTVNNLDQRGDLRPKGNACDIGAFELYDCAVQPWPVHKEADLNDAILCFNAQTVAATYAITLTQNISLTASSRTMSNAMAGTTLVLEGNGFTVDGQNKLGVRPFRVNNDTTVIIQNITVSNGRIRANGGGILNNGTLTVHNSTLSGNSAFIEFGGGIYNRGSLTINNSTLHDNKADWGGGIYSEQGSLAISNSTFSNNLAYFDGGGIYHRQGYLTISYSTLSGNSASDSGGGIYNADTMTIGNSIIANSSGGDCRNESGGASDNGYNLIEGSGRNACGLTDGTNGSIIGSDPLLGSLQNNGGSTLTHALLAGSPALDQIPNGANECGTTITSDQRGEARPQNGACDMGAYEVVGETAVSPILTISNSQLTHSNNNPSCIYNLHHSNSPYSGFSLAQADIGTTPIDISGAMGSTPDYYYVEVDCGGGGVQASNTVGEFSFVIVPGN